jgi:cytidylate kinase
VATVDSSDLDFEQTVDAVLAVVAQAEAATSRA